MNTFQNMFYYFTRFFLTGTKKKKKKVTKVQKKMSSSGNAEKPVTEKPKAHKKQELPERPVRGEEYADRIAQPQGEVDPTDQFLMMIIMFLQFLTKKDPILLWGVFFFGVSLQMNVKNGLFSPKILVAAGALIMLLIQYYNYHAGHLPLPEKWTLDMFLH